MRLALLSLACALAFSRLVSGVVSAAEEDRPVSAVPVQELRRLLSWRSLGPVRQARSNVHGPSRGVPDGPGWDNDP